ncbi:MAG: hypothetical protein ACYDEG_10565 [bacterium]
MERWTLGDDNLTEGKDKNKDIDFTLDDFSENINGQDVRKKLSETSENNKFQKKK